MLVGFTAKSTRVTLNGVGVADGGADVVAVGEGPGLLLLPHATREKTTRPVKANQRGACFSVFLRVRGLNIMFHLSPKRGFAEHMSTMLSANELLFSSADL